MELATDIRNIIIIITSLVIKHVRNQYKEGFQRQLEMQYLKSAIMSDIYSLDQTFDHSNFSSTLLNQASNLTKNCL